MKRQRKIMQKALGTPAISTYYPMLKAETSGFLRRLIADPSNYMKITRRYGGGVFLLVFYGYEAVSEDDAFLRLGEDVVDLVGYLMSGGGIWLVDVFPFLRLLPGFLPGMGFKRTAAKAKALFEEFVNKPYEYTKDAMVCLTNLSSSVAL